MDQSTCATPSSTSTPQDDRSDADRAAFRAASYVRIPTVKYTPGMYDQKRIDAELAATEADIPGQHARKAIR